MRKGGREGWRVKKGGERERASERGMGGGGREGRRDGEREGGWEPERSQLVAYIIFLSTC